MVSQEEGAAFQKEVVVIFFDLGGLSSCTEQTAFQLYLLIGVIFPLSLYN